MIGWMLKTKEGRYLAGLKRDGRFVVMDEQAHAVRWPSKDAARELGAIIGMTVVGLRIRQKGVAIIGAGPTGGKET